MVRTSRLTKQKEIINIELKKIDSFFTAENLFVNVKKKNKEIGLATIYRFLKELREQGKIFSYTCDGKLIYSREKKSHCHFICEKTNKIVHFDIDSLDFLKNKIPGTITSFQIEVRGTCEKCDKSK
ncbi:MAG: transcriptional repressor [Candidatus Woesearchaeota archaeon]|jgi:Fur family ferric uptake transcriptional regulator